MLVLILPTLVGVFWILLPLAVRLYEYYKFRQTIKKIPGVTGWPVLGNAPVFFEKNVPLAISARHGLNWMAKQNYEHGMFRYSLGGSWRVCLFRADTIERLLQRPSEISKANKYGVSYEWVGKGLVTSDGHQWHKNRRLITPAFHFRILQNFVPIINSHAKKFMDIFTEQPTDENGFIEINKSLKRCTLNIICECAMGVSLISEDIEYEIASERLAAIIMKRAFSPMYWNEFIFKRTTLGKEWSTHLKTVNDFTNRIINQRKEDLRQLNKDDTEDQIKEELPEEDSAMIYRPKQRLAFLDLILQHNLNPADQTMTDKEVRDEMNTFAFAGHETTFTTLLWAIFMVGNLPEVQRRLHEELDEVFAEDLQRNVTWDDLHKLNYLDMVIKEVMRFRTTVPLLGRELKTDMTINGFVIPKGTTCAILTEMLHCNPDVFPEPEKFDPERFSIDNSSGRHPFAYIPFSGGPRNCVAQRFATLEMKIILATIFRHLSVTSREKIDEIEPAYSTTLHPSKPIAIQVKHRTN